MPNQITLRDEHTPALGEFLRQYGGSGELTITVQGDGSAIFAVPLVTWEVTSAGTVFNDDGEEVELVG